MRSWGGWVRNGIKVYNLYAAGGVADGSRGDDCKPYWSRVKIPTWFLFFSLIFVRIHTNEFIQLLYKLCNTNSYTVRCLYQFIHFLCDFCTNSYIFIQIARARPEPRGRSPSTPPAPTRPHPAAPTLGYTWLPRPLGYTRLPRR